MMLVVLSALAAPARVAATRMPGDRSEPCDRDHMCKLDATQSRLSGHMRILRHARLVVARRDAPRVRSRLRRDAALPQEFAA